MLEFILVRHGETDWNAGEVFRGRADVPLNDTGRRQAELLADYLAAGRVDAVYSSPLARALQTAEAIAARHSMEVQVAEGLVDIDFGIWQGMSLKDVIDRYKDIHDDWLYLPEQVRLPGGECLNEVRQRAGEVVVSIAEGRQDGRVVLVSHRVVHKLLICTLLGLDNTHFWNIRLDTCGITSFTLNLEEFVLNWHNDTSFLRPLGLGPRPDF